MSNGSAKSPLPSRWIRSTVGEVFTVVGGGTPATSVASYWNGGIPWITSADIVGVREIVPRKAVSEEGVRHSATNVVPAHTIVVVTRVGLGKVGLTDRPLAFSQDCQGLFGDPTLVDPSFAAYQLLERVQAFKYEGRGTTISGVTKKQLLDLPFDLAPYAEQRRIVAAIEEHFSRIDAGVEALKRARQNLQLMRAAVMTAASEGRLHSSGSTPRRSERSVTEVKSIVAVARNRPRRAGRLWGSGSVPELTAEERTRLPEGWKWVKVLDLGVNPDEAVQVGPMSMRSRDFADDGVPVLNVGSVQWGFIDETRVNRLPLKLAHQFDRYRVCPGDVLFTRSGTVGRAAVVSERHRDWLMTFHLLRVRPDPNKCLPEFLRIVFEGARHIRRQTQHGAIGTTRAGFNTNLLAYLDVPLPPIEEQESIILEVERLVSWIAAARGLSERNMRRVERLRTSILAAAFSGKLVSQDTRDESSSVLLERIKAARFPRELATQRPRGDVRR